MSELFKTAPKEVVDYFDRRPSVPTFAWTDVAPREHALAHTVAKTAGFDVIEDLRAGIRQAVVERKSFEAFRTELTPILQAKGWWGRQIATDPLTGRDQIVQLGSPRRLRTIYWANVASAEAAGEWARTQATKDVLPFLEYLTSLSERKRPHHMALVGTTLPVDDPFWATHYPPNGWHCKCRVRQISAPAAERKPADKRVAPPIEMRTWRNKRTGEIEQVPVGIDPGWQHNPGLLRDRTLSNGLTGALDRLPDTARRDAIAALRRHPVFDYVARNEAGLSHAHIREPEVAAAGRFRAAVADLPVGLGERLGAKSRIVSLSLADAVKQQAKHVEALDAYDAVQELLDAPAAVRQVGTKLEVVGMIDGEPWIAIVKRTADGRELYLNSYHRLRDEQYERALREGE